MNMIVTIFATLVLPSCRASRHPEKGEPCLPPVLELDPMRSPEDRYIPTVRRMKYLIREFNKNQRDNASMLPTIDLGSALAECSREQNSLKRSKTQTKRPIHGTHSRSERSSPKNDVSAKKVTGKVMGNAQSLEPTEKERHDVKSIVSRGKDISGWDRAGEVGANGWLPALLLSLAGFAGIVISALCKKMAEGPDAMLMRWGYPSLAIFGCAWATYGYITLIFYLSPNVKKTRSNPKGVAKWSEFMQGVGVISALGMTGTATALAWQEGCGQAEDFAPESDQMITPELLHAFLIFVAIMVLIPLLKWGIIKCFYRRR